VGLYDRQETGWPLPTGKIRGSNLVWVFVKTIFVSVVVVSLAFVSVWLGMFIRLIFFGLWLGTFFQRTSLRLLFDLTFVRLTFVSLLLGGSMVGNSMQRSSVLFKTHKTSNGLSFVVGVASKMTTFSTNSQLTSRTLRVARGGWSICSMMHTKSFGGAITL
jgi:hypothetical protein